MLFTRAAIRRIQRALLAFFDESARDLPWRGTRDPYAVWISEVMLQQTRVEAAIPYYERWLQRFPDLDTLADAPVDDVLKHWEGLGYYSRARNLHAAARVVRERHHGALPDSYARLRELPGIGDYTAGAVASIAFAAREPAVDGNVRRVVSRLLDLPAPPARLVRDAAAALVPRERPGDFNQALMELGARVCVPRTPRCASCPLRRECRAHAAGTQHSRPAPKARRDVPVIDLATVVLHDDEQRMLIVRRGERGLLARLWNFPAVEMAAGQSDVCALAAALALDLCGAPAGAVRAFATIEHAFSHRRERYHCVLAHVTATPALAAHRATIRAADAAPVPAAEHAWIGADTAAWTLPRAQQRIHRAALLAMQTAGSA